MLGTILIVILVGAVPTWGHSRNWGYVPSGGLGLVVLMSHPGINRKHLIALIRDP